MDLDRGFAGSNFGGYLLVGKAGNNQRQHFSLTGGQPFKALPQSGNIPLLFASGRVAFEGDVNRIQEVLIAKRLWQEVDGASLQGPDRHLNVTVAGDKDNRNGIVRLSQLALEVEPLIPGNLISRIRQLGAFGRLLCRNSCAELKSSTCKPTDRIRLLSALRTDASSSTTNTMDGSSVMRSCPR